MVKTIRGATVPKSPQDCNFRNELASTGGLVYSLGQQTADSEQLTARLIREEAD
jgi:hypothetical protein